MLFFCKGSVIQPSFPPTLYSEISAISPTAEAETKPCALKRFLFFFNLISDAKISTHLRSNKIEKVPVPVDVNNHSDHYHLLWSLRDILFTGQAPNDWNGDGFKQSRHDVEQVHGTRVWWTRVWPFLRGFDVFHGRFRSVDGRTLLHQ